MRAGYRTSTDSGDSFDIDGATQTALDLRQESQLAADAERRKLNEHMVDVDTLAALGFPRPHCAAVLMECNLDVERAGAILLAEAEQRQVLTSRLVELRSSATPNASEIRAISLKLEEYEKEDLRCAQIEAENEELDLKQEKEDAENWDGRGDLMVSGCRQRHMQLEKQTKGTVGALCAGGDSAKLFGTLKTEGVGVLYDFRSAPEHAPGQLRNTAVSAECKGLGVRYKQISLGRDGTGGVDRHLGQDEGRHALAELLWFARRGRSAYLADDDGGHHREAIATAFRHAGHTVQFLGADPSSHTSRVSKSGNAVDQELAEWREQQKRNKTGNNGCGTTAATRQVAEESSSSKSPSLPTGYCTAETPALASKNPVAPPLSNKPAGPQLAVSNKPLAPEVSSDDWGPGRLLGSANPTAAAEPRVIPSDGAAGAVEEENSAPRKNRWSRKAAK
eukprot:gnl/TRDRNA2_/TRDRNA2_74786_c0_seq1.p1 gnl/TRDRNA2_/TRDRNA2_74786_c0~~gnl/TRDRNA2_/TRDRNA2_74786_c0_seq1.p1  ORF type:complete len:449 (+),score=71.46 gnl/TRDRNA2_/TRDRNA2_74786_c0_seq1:2-1348(+)